MLPRLICLLKKCPLKRCRVKQNASITAHIPVRIGHDPLRPGMNRSPSSPVSARSPLLLPVWPPVQNVSRLHGASRDSPESIIPASLQETFPFSFSMIMPHAVMTRGACPIMLRIVLIYSFRKHSGIFRITFLLHSLLIVSNFPL